MNLSKVAAVFAHVLHKFDDSESQAFHRAYPFIRILCLSYVKLDGFKTARSVTVC